MNLDEKSKEILLSLWKEGATPSSDMDPGNPLMPHYEVLERKGLVILRRSEEGGVIWLSPTSLGKAIQKEIS